LTIDGVIPTETVRLAGGSVNTRVLPRLAWGAAAVVYGLVAAEAMLLYLDRSVVNAVSITYANNLLVPLSLAALGALVASRQPRNPVGWIILGLGGALVVNSIAPLAATRVQMSGTSATAWAQWLEWSTTWTWLLFFPAGLTVALFLLLPNGRLGHRRWRWLLWFDLVYTAAEIVLLALDPTPTHAARSLPALDNPIGLQAMPSVQGGDPVGGLLLLPGLALLLLTVIALLHRLYRSRGDERQQLKWIVYASGTVIVADILASLLNASGVDPNGYGGDLAGLLGLGVAIPASFGVAILKYGLYEIDVVISRTLVYGALAALITAVYVGIVVGVGYLIGSGGRPNLVLSILATAVVAVGFQPARERLQKIANRLVYGKRATPYEVLSEFSQRVADTYAADEALPKMAKVLAQGTGAERATVWLRRGDRLAPAATWPPLDAGDDSALSQPQHVNINDETPQIPGADKAVPVRHQEELLGVLAISKRRGESLTPVEEKLLSDLASQAGLVLKNVGLTSQLLERLDELRNSRQRLVAAQDGERRRLERNLHDGAQQNLVAIKVKLGLAEMLAGKDAPKARQLLAELKADTDAALDTLRDLARGIYPPLLADKGLRAALEAQARKATVAVEVATDGIGRYPQEVEAAVYFCVLEALQNIQKYAEASLATVRLSERDGVVNFYVEDDGKGFDAATAKRGAGLTNMSDRLDALGGGIEVESKPGSGVRVRGSIPVPAGAPA
jgi:signal transduction histidine kinase